MPVMFEYGIQDLALQVLFKLDDILRYRARIASCSPKQESWNSCLVELLPGSSQR